MHVLVVSTVDNETIHQEALALARAGMQVTLVLAHPRGRPRETSLGPVRVEHVPVDYLLRDARRATNVRRRTGMILTPPADTDTARVRRVRLALAIREMAALPASTSRRTRAKLRARLACQPPLRYLQATVRRCWRAFDRLNDSTSFGASWRRLFPETDDLDLAVGPVIDHLQPDRIHATGAAVFPLAARAVARALPRHVDMVLDTRRGHGLSTADALTIRQKSALRSLTVKHTRWAQHFVESDSDIHSIYSLGQVSPSTPSHEFSLAPQPIEHSSHPRTRFVGIGIENFAGQAWQWMQALRSTDVNTRTEVLGRKNYLRYPADVQVSRQMYERDITWGLNKREACRQVWTHAILESGNPLFGCLKGSDPRCDIEYLESGGVRTALVFHGSDVRDPVQHASQHRWSPFRGEGREGYWIRKRNLELLRDFDGPIFVSTPDLLTYVPNGVWLPLVVDLDHTPVTIGQPRKLPLVVHATTNPAIKGSHYVDLVAHRLAAEGLIEYRRLSGISHEAALTAIRSADIVVDQLLLGAYGVLACEAMACGAAVIGYLGDDFRSRIPEPIPILEAEPDTLDSVLRLAVAEIQYLRDRALERRSFVHKWHSGEESARVLSKFVG